MAGCGLNTAGVLGGAAASVSSPVAFYVDAVAVRSFAAVGATLLIVLCRYAGALT
jgi:hypothetical protein